MFNLDHPHVVSSNTTKNSPTNGHISDLAWWMSHSGISMIERYVESLTGNVINRDALLIIMIMQVYDVKDLHLKEEIGVLIVWMN